MTGSAPWTSTCSTSTRRGRWAALDHEQDLGSSTATIYHFGMAGDGTCHGYAYRSTAGFASERLVHGLYAKPHPEQPMHWDDFDGVDTMVSLAERIRREQSALPADERIYVGGELTLTRLTDEVLLMTTVHRFADFDVAWALMCDELDNTQGPTVR